jgi:hypothetical protein
MTHEDYGKSCPTRNLVTTLSYPGSQIDSRDSQPKISKSIPAYKETLLYLHVSVVVVSFQDSERGWRKVIYIYIYTYTYVHIYTHNMSTWWQRQRTLGARNFFPQIAYITTTSTFLTESYHLVHGRGLRCTIHRWRCKLRGDGLSQA